MKKRNYSQWNKNDYFKGLLLFAQTLEECTFHYSYESYKLAALNSHYLCYDILRTVNDINNKVLMAGNFNPLAEEFEQNLNEDLFICDIVNNKGTILFSKDKNGNLHDISKEDFKQKIEYYSEIAEYVKDICESGYIYLNYLSNELKLNIFSRDLTYDNCCRIYILTRMLVTEFINFGYSKEYVHHTVINYFFDESRPIECSSETLDGFFSCFSLELSKYKVVLGCNEKAGRIFQKIKNVSVGKPTVREQKQLNIGMNSHLLIIHLDALDAYSAYEKTIHYVNQLKSLHQLNQHNSKLSFSKQALVYQKIDEKYLPTSGIRIKSSVNPMKKEGNSSEIQALVEDVILIESSAFPISFYRAISLHSAAINSSDVSNQLLNLWTVIEVLIETKRDNEDKINTVCTILGAVLNRCYMYSNIEQLLYDVTSCSSINMDDLLGTIKSETKEIDNVEKMALLLSLKENSHLVQKMISSVDEYPLLVYRIKLYSEHILLDSQSIYKDLKRHEKRIKWHIMRIYRNRNMIVHNGNYMPYRNIITENLHYYVDILINTLIEYYNRGIFNHSSIYKDILNQQVEHYVELGQPLKSNNSKFDNKELTPENALSLIFNGYAGVEFKKAVKSLIKSNSEQQSNDNNIPMLHA